MSERGTPVVPVSWGELLDKMTILEIKQAHLSSAAARAHVREELCGPDRHGLQGCDMTQRPIGILTFHRCINDGSHWQARCLVEAVRATSRGAALLDHWAATYCLRNGPRMWSPC